MSMLEVSGIRKSFGTLEVLKGVDLTVNKGDVVAILGPSGSGKTTLLRCVNFLERADAGALTFDGERFDLGKIKNSDIARLRKKTAFVFQNYNLFLNKTAVQNVTEGLMTARKMPRDEAFSKAEEALRRVGMLDRRDHYPTSSQAGSSNGWPSPEHWPPILRSSTLTSPPRPWTPSSLGRSWPLCGTWPRAA